jgi:hypothetical protein
VIHDNRNKRAMNNEQSTNRDPACHRARHGSTVGLDHYNKTVIVAASVVAAAATVKSGETNKMDSQVDPAQSASFVEKAALSGDTSPFTDAPVTASAAEEKNETDNRIKLAPMIPPVPETAKFMLTSLIAIPLVTNETSSEVKSALRAKTKAVY